MIKKESSFSRSLYNEAKLGAYYTDLNHAARIGKLFNLPEEVCILEPSVGDGKAVEAFVNAAGKKGAKIHIYGVEINPVTYEATKNKMICLNEDFIKGVKISNKVFSLCFANPPYGNYEKGRLETKFIEKIYNHLVPGGFLVLIVSASILENSNFLKILFSRYEILEKYRFDDREYQKFKQIVLICRSKNISLIEYTDELCNTIDLSLCNYLPTEDNEFSPKYNVSCSLKEKIKFFESQKFDPRLARDSIRESKLNALIHEKISIKEYSFLEMGQPPVPLKKDLSYLVCVAGGGEGFAGNEENGDLHLQRGNVRKKFEKEITYNEEKEVCIEREIQSNQITLKIITNSGKIIALE